MRCPADISALCVLSLPSPPILQPDNHSRREMKVQIERAAALAVQLVKMHQFRIELQYQLDFGYRSRSDHDRNGLPYIKRRILGKIAEVEKQLAELMTKQRNHGMSNTCSECCLLTCGYSRANFRQS